MTNVSKIQKNKMCLMCFDRVAVVFVIMTGQRIYTYIPKFSWGFSVCLIPFFQRYFGLISCIIFIIEFVFLTMITMGIGKSQFLSYHRNACYSNAYHCNTHGEKLCFTQFGQNWILFDFFWPFPFVYTIN